MDKKILPILLLTGYLGSGKTTLLNRILNNKRGIRFAVIVNDIGEVNIDADLIQKGGIVNQSDDSLVALQNGCICCTLQMDLVNQINQIAATEQFDYVVIEASGICEPEPIARTICMMPGVEETKRLRTIPVLDCICTVVDALRMRDEFGCGNDLTRKNIGEEDIENLLIQQIEFCNIILVNKAAEVTTDQMERIRKILRALQPSARIIECNYADVDLALLLNTHKFDYGQVSGSATWVRELERPVDELDDDEHEHHHHHEDEDDEHGHHHHHEDEDDEHGHHHHHEDEDDEHEHHHHHHHHHHHDGGEVEEYGISTFVYYRRPPFDITKFDRFVSQKWSRSIIRAKGVCYFAQNTDMSYLFEQAGQQKKLTEAGQWYATAPEDELIEFMRQEPGLVRDWDPEYGDRMQKIVFIGHDMDREQIIRDLDNCLVDNE